MDEEIIRPKRVCAYHGVEVSVKETIAGHRRFYCKKCKKFLFNNQIKELEPQIFYILERLNSMDNELGRIWEIAFYHPYFPKMKNGIPEHNLGELFVTLHNCQRSILGIETGIPKSFWNRPSMGYDAQIKAKETKKE